MIPSRERAMRTRVPTRRLAAWLTAVSLTAALAACGKKDSGSPTTPSPPSSPTVSLSGTVRNPQGALAGALVEVIGGTNSGQSTVADGAGRFVLSNLATGSMTVRASAAGHLPQSQAVTISAGMVLDFTLLVAPFSMTGRAVGVLSQAGLGGLAISGAAFAGVTDAAGDFSLFSATDDDTPRQVLFRGSGIVDRQTQIRVPGPHAIVSMIPAGFDLASFDQMLRAPGLRRWANAPRLVIEQRALQFSSVNASSAVALADLMSAEETDTLVADLSAVLSQFTGSTISGFSQIDRVLAADGQSVPLLNTGQITVARLVGLTQATGFWGYGRWQWVGGGTVVAGLVMLDRDFERSGSEFIAALRAHELGHALGYNHVTNRASVMNSSARLLLTPWDLDAFRIAFQRSPGNRSPDVDPQEASVNTASQIAIWGPPIR